jgi:hypothetical protein
MKPESSSTWRNHIDEQVCNESVRNIDTDMKIFDQEIFIDHQGIGDGYRSSILSSEIQSGRGANLKIGLSQHPSRDHPYPNENQRYAH